MMMNVISSFQMVYHTSDVPSFLPVPDPQHCVRCPYQRQHTDWDQRQCVHFCSGVVWWRCKCSFLQLFNNKPEIKPFPSITVVWNVRQKVHL